MRLSDETVNALCDTLAALVAWDTDMGYWTAPVWQRARHLYIEIKLEEARTLIDMAKACGKEEERP